MSNLTDSDERYLEKILDMNGGYVLDYNDQTFGEFFRRHKIDIHSSKYQIYGTSKAKKMRAFWEQEPDAIVAPILSRMLDIYQTNCDLGGKEIDTKLLSKSREIVAKLAGKPPEVKLDTIDAFLHREFTIPNIQNLPIEPQVATIIESRLEEARKALGAGAYLSVIFLCGSVLEGVLLGMAQNEPAKFNRSPTSPKDSDGKVKKFQDWTLKEFIDTACEVKLLKPDVQKFSHGLRDFRNYIHPYQQLVSRFTPDEHTAKVCFQVLKAALASLAGERR